MKEITKKERRGTEQLEIEAPDSILQPKKMRKQKGEGYEYQPKHKEQNMIQFGNVFDNVVDTNDLFNDDEDEVD
jgi:hypothetical protein